MAGAEQGPRNLERDLTRRAGELKFAYEAWSQSADKGRNFTLGWMRANGFAGLEQWIYRNEGQNVMVKLLERVVVDHPNIALDFRQQSPYELETALAALNQARQRWEQEPAELRGAFNARWLHDHGLDHLRNYVHQNGGLSIFAAAASKETDRAFSQKHEWSEAEAVHLLRYAYHEWAWLPDGERPVLDNRWLSDHGYSYAERWMRQHGGVSKYVALAGGPVEQAWHTTEVASGNLFQNKATT